MHATSLQTLVLLVAQAAPGGDFQPANDKLDVPDLIVPSLRTTPKKTSQAEPKATEDRTTDPAPTLPATSLPEKNSERNAPPDFVPPNNTQVPTPPSDFGSPAVVGNTENSPSVIPEMKTADSPSIGLRIADQPERAASSIPQNPVRSLFLGPNRKPWTETKRLIHQALEPTDASLTSSGQPTSLRQALARVSQRDQRIAVIKTYWRLSVAISDLNHAQDEVQLLTTLPDPWSEIEGAHLTAAVLSAAARLSETKLALLSTQHELAELTNADKSSLPLTIDVPFVGSYEPKFEEIFAGRPAPGNLRKLAESFPLYLELINARARSVLAAETTLEKLAARYPQGDVAFSEILDAFAQLRDQRIALLATVRDYNNAIADYSLNTINVGLNTDAVVATLIETEPAASVLVSPSGVRPASGVAPLRAAGQPTPVAQPPQIPPAATRLVPVEQPADQFVPRRVRQTAPSQPAPLSPIADPTASGPDFRR